MNQEFPECPRCGENKMVSKVVDEIAGPREYNWVCSNNHTRGWSLGGGDPNKYWFFNTEPTDKPIVIKKHIVESGERAISDKPS